MNNNNTATLSLASILGIVFIVLKLCKVINWTWGWVLAPFWIPVVLVIVVCVLCKIIVTIGESLENKKHNK